MCQHAAMHVCLTRWRRRGPDLHSTGSSATSRQPQVLPLGQCTNTEAPSYACDHVAGSTCSTMRTETQAQTLCLHTIAC